MMEQPFQCAHAADCTWPAGNPARSVHRSLQSYLDAAAIMDDLSGVHQAMAAQSQAVGILNDQLSPAACCHCAGTNES